MFHSKSENEAGSTTEYISSVAFLVRLAVILFIISIVSAVIFVERKGFKFDAAYISTIGTALISVILLFFVQTKYARAVKNIFTVLKDSTEQSNRIIADRTREAAETVHLMEQVSIHFNELFRRIPAPCFCFDCDGRFKEWNRAFENLTLIDPGSIINEFISKIVSLDDDSSKVQSLVTAVFQGESFEGIELQIVFPDGTNKTILCNMFPLRGEGGIVTAAICAGIDITERIRLEQRMLSHVEMLSAAQLKLEEQHGELIAANEQLEMLAMSDSLTGLKNHRALQERLTAEFKRCVRYGSPLSVLLLDVDRFKKYNDSYGHLAGDSVLRDVADVLSSSMRDTDFVARYGGEEFVVVLPHTDYLGALEAAERLRSSIEQSPWELIRVTVSVGVSTLRPNMTHPTDLIAQADIALYYCKQHGRNMVIHVQDLPPAPQSAENLLSSVSIDSDLR